MEKVPILDITSICLLLFVPSITKLVDARAPNILLIVADDLGYNDVSWHNPDILSPHLDRLARTGTILEQFYVQPICTPSRATLMTGYHPIHTGRQTSIIWPQEPRGLFTNFTLMPEYLNQLGYRSHIVGKWHLGYCNEEYLPTRRGFETFSGFYLGSEDYYTHLRGVAGGGKPGYDFRKNDEVYWEANGTYSAMLFARDASRLISDHAKKHPDEPLFLYLPFQDTHMPLQVPKKYSDLYPNIKNNARKMFSGMVTVMDEAVGNVTKALKKAGLYDNTLIIFTADNGGQTLAGGNNFPLRGNKGTMWEGGQRASAFIHAPFLKKTAATVYNGIGEMKLIRGDAGRPDGWIPPAKVTWLSEKDQQNIGHHFSKQGCRPDQDTPYQLYNLTADPTEHYDVSRQHPDIVARLIARLESLERTMIPPDVAPDVPEGNPNNFGGVFTTGWCKSRPEAKKADSDMGQDHGNVVIDVLT